MSWNAKDYEDAGFDKHMKFKRDSDIFKEKFATPDIRDLDIIDTRGPQVFSQGYIELTDTETEKTISHNLGYIPNVLAFSKQLEFALGPDIPVDTWSALPIDFAVEFSITITSITFSRGFSGSIMGTPLDTAIKYFILSERI